MGVQTILHHSPHLVTAEIIHWFGSLENTMASLFLGIIGNLSWDVIVRPLHSLSPPLAVLWGLCACYCIYGVLNLLSGILVDQVISDTKEHARSSRADAFSEGRTAVVRLQHLLETDKKCGGKSWIGSKRAQKILKDK